MDTKNGPIPQKNSITELSLLSLTVKQLRIGNFLFRIIIAMKQPLAILTFP